MTVTRHPALTALLIVAGLLVGGLLVETLSRIGRAYGDTPVVAELAAGTTLDAGPIAPDLDAGPAAAPAKTPPPPADPVAHPGDALDGFGLWWKTGWPMGVLFVIGSVLVALGAHVKRLQTGKAAIVIATATAAIVAFLGAKAGGMSGAQAMAGTLSVLFGGVLWLMKPNSSTVDLSKATDAQILAMLGAAVASKPPAVTRGGPA